MRKSRNRIMKMKWLVWGCIAASIGILGSCRNKQVQDFCHLSWKNSGCIECETGLPGSRTYP